MEKSVKCQRLFQKKKIPNKAHVRETNIGASKLQKYVLTVKPLLTPPGSYFSNRVGEGSYWRGVVNRGGKLFF
jgi:hypothetical protein